MSDKEGKFTKEVPSRIVGHGKYKDKTFLWVVKNDLEYFKQIEELYLKKYNFATRMYYENLKRKYIKYGGREFNSEIATERTNEVVDLIRNLRMEPSEIVKYLMKHHGVSEQSAKALIGDANLFIRKSFEIERDSIFELHLTRYEQIWETNINPDVSHVPPKYRLATLCHHKTIAMDSLLQKENLLGVHTKEFKARMAASSFRGTKESEFDMSKLELHEQLELLEILRKAKIKIEIIKPVIKPPFDDFIEVSEEVKEGSDTPIRSSIETDTVGEERKLISQKIGKTIEEVQETIHKSLQDKIKEAFEKAKNK